MSACRDKDVGRLDVAMNDPFGVCRLQRVGNLNRRRWRNWLVLLKVEWKVGQCLGGEITVSLVDPRKGGFECNRDVSTV